MAYITKSEARAAGANAARFGNAQSVLAVTLESYKEDDQFDVFLSHSSDDVELVLGVMSLLREQGLKVYVDWVVDTLLERNLVNRNTASILRNRMKQSHSLIYLATGNATHSKWMPWELGFFDGFKTDKIAILPVVNTANEVFEGQEYLSLYPQVSKETKDGATEYVVKVDGSNEIHLKDFVSGMPILV